MNGEHDREPSIRLIVDLNKDSESQYEYDAAREMWAECNPCLECAGDGEIEDDNGTRPCASCDGSGIDPLAEFSNDDGGSATLKE